MTDLLLIIDMNNGFAKEGALYSPRTQKLIAPVAAFAEDAKKNGWDVIGVTDCHNENDAEFACFPPHCLKGTEESEFVTEIAAFCDRIVPKVTTTFFPWMEEDSGIPDVRKYDAIHFAGCCTDLCIFNCSLVIQKYLEQAYHNGKLSHKPRVIVHKDLVETYDMPGHNAEEINKFFFETQFGLNGIEVL